MGLDIHHDLLLVRTAQYVDRMFVALSRKLYIYLTIFGHMIFDAEAQDHFQNDQNILNRFMAQSFVELPKYESLYVLFLNESHFAEYRQNVIFNQ